MFEYIYYKVQEFATYIEAALIFSPAWHYFTRQSTILLSSFFTSRAVLIVFSLCFLDIIAKWLSIYCSPSAKIDTDIAYKKWAKKMMIWFFWLAVAFIFRYFGASLVAYPIELAMVLIEGGSIIKNICECSDSPFIRSIGANFETQMETKVTDSFKPMNFGIHLYQDINANDLAHSNTFNPYPRQKYSMEIKEDDKP